MSGVVDLLTSHVPDTKLYFDVVLGEDGWAGRERRKGEEEEGEGEGGRNRERGRKQNKSSTYVQQ